MFNESNPTVATMGIDIGKNSFHVVGLDQRGTIVLRQKWSRGQGEARLANLPPCLRDCGTAMFSSPLLRLWQSGDRMRAKEKLGSCSVTSLPQRLYERKHEKSELVKAQLRVSKMIEQFINQMIWRPLAAVMSVFMIGRGAKELRGY